MSAIDPPRFVGPAAPMLSLRLEARHELPGNYLCAANAAFDGPLEAVICHDGWDCDEQADSSSHQSLGNAAHNELGSICAFSGCF